MKVALTQREIVLENTAGKFVFDGLERSWYNFLPHHDLFPIPNLCQKDFSKYDVDCVIFTGGPDSYHRHVTENSLYLWAVLKNIPIIGVCHGAFAINDLSGGKNGLCDGHYDTLHSISMDQTEYQVNSYHSQSIVSLGPNFHPCAWNQDDDIEAFEHAVLPIHAVVWHPERQEYPVLPKSIKNILQIA